MMHTTTDITTPLARDLLERSVSQATDALLKDQRADGHWVFELEADATIPAEYVLLRHYLGEPVDAELERKIAVYLRRIQGRHDGWPLFHEGAFDMSASVKAYFALKMIGDSPEADHMRRAREAIIARGGASRSNVFTRALLALYGVVSWRAVPVMPVEIMLLPRWFPFHLTKVSYWARTVIVPLLVLGALKPLARNPKGVTIDELFLESPKSVGGVKKAPHQKWSWFLFFRGVDVVLRATEPLFPKSTRKRAIDAAVAFVKERLNGEDGLGAIYPAMANSVMMYDVLGYPEDHPDRAVARLSIDKLLVIKDDEAYCQPCVSPVWDTALTAHAMLEAGSESRQGCGEGGSRLAEAVAGARRQGRLGGRRGRMCGRAAGRFNTTTPIIPTSTTPRSSSWRWIAPRPTAATGPTIRPLRARANGCSVCRARMAAGARSMPTTTTAISTIFRSPITARCSIRRPKM